MSDQLSQYLPYCFSPNLQGCRTVPVNERSKVSFSIPQGVKGRYRDNQ